MRTRTIIATILIFIAFFVHTVGGELSDIRSLMSSVIPSNIKTEFRAVWYLLSVDFGLSGIFMIMMLTRKSINENKLLMHFIGIRMFVYGGTFLLLIFLSDIGLLFEVPQWILLMLIGILSEWTIFKKNADT